MIDGSSMTLLFPHQLPNTVEHFTNKDRVNIWELQSFQHIMGFFVGFANARIKLHNDVVEVQFEVMVAESLILLRL